jgi:hypothetical protein
MYIRSDDFAKLANLKLSSLYNYHSRKLFDFPAPAFTVGRVHLWKRTTAVAWARKHNKRR